MKKMLFDKFRMSKNKLLMRFGRKQIGYRCIECGSGNLWFRSAVVWIESTQRYRIIVTSDLHTCMDCNHKGKIVDKVDITTGEILN